jgi:hypothetical protein
MYLDAPMYIYGASRGTMVSTDKRPLTRYARVKAAKVLPRSPVRIYVWRIYYIYLYIHRVYFTRGGGPDFATRRSDRGVRPGGLRKRTCIGKLIAPNVAARRCGEYSFTCAVKVL